MALQIDTGIAVGIREDLSDLISIISPTEVPFQSAVRKGKVSNKIYEWQTDALAAASLNAIAEGNTAPVAAVTPTVRQRNWTQILTKVAKTTGTVDAVDKAGRAKEMAYQLQKVGKEIKRDLELSLCQNTVANSGNPGVTASVFKGLEGWLGDNNDLGASGVAPNPEAAGGLGTAPTDGTARAFTETLLKNVLQSVYTAGGDPSIIMTGPGNRAVFSTFDGVSSQQQLDVSSNKIVGTMSVYESDWGTLKVVPNRFQRNRTAFIIDPKGFELVTLRPLFTQDLATTGDFQSKQLIMECGLKVDNWRAHGAIRDLT